MNDHQEIQDHQERLRQQVLRKEALERLQVNSDFVLLFKDYYCNLRVLELVDSLALYDKDSLEHKASTDELNIISNFKKFLNEISTNGAMAVNALAELHAILDEDYDND